MRMHVGAVGEGVNLLLEAVAINMNKQVDAEFGRSPVAKLDHFSEFPGGVDVEERERRLAGIKCLHRQMQHDGGVLAHRIEHDRFRKGRGDLSEYVDRLGFQALQMS